MRGRDYDDEARALKADPNPPPDLPAVLPKSATIASKLGSWPHALHLAGFIDDAELDRRLARVTVALTDKQLLMVMADALRAIGANASHTRYRPAMRAKHGPRVGLPSLETVYLRLGKWPEATARVIAAFPISRPAPRPGPRRTTSSWTPASTPARRRGHAPGDARIPQTSRRHAQSCPRSPSPSALRAALSSSSPSCAAKRRAAAAARPEATRLALVEQLARAAIGQHWPDLEQLAGAWGGFEKACQQAWRLWEQGTAARVAHTREHARFDQSRYQREHVISTSLLVITVVSVITVAASLWKARRDPAARAHAGSLRSTRDERGRSSSGKT
jgi:hypothetical protein